MKKNHSIILRYAFKKSLPVMCGYLFLGFAFGILLQQAGYSAVWAFFISLLVYAGSMQFVLVTLLSAGAALPTVAMMTLFINCRHMFYGLSFVESFKKMGKKYLYMIFSLTDETYSLFFITKVPKDVDERKFLLAVALLDQCYWILGSVIGALAGHLLPFDSTGVDFAMTALFLVIMTEQWLAGKNHIPALVGLGSAFVCRLIFGASNFILPSMICILLILLSFRKVVEEKEVDTNAP